MNLFLTGKRQIGKTTVLMRILKEIGKKYCGIRSVTVNDVPDGKSVFLEDINNPRKTMKAGIRRNNQNFQIIYETFDSFGVRLLSTDSGFVVIDEIGNMEQNALLYTERITELLKNPDIDVFGVIRLDAEGKLADAVRKYSTVIEVTGENREELHFNSNSGIVISDKSI